MLISHVDSRADVKVSPRFHWEKRSAVEKGFDFCGGSRSQTAVGVYVTYFCTLCERTKDARKKRNVLLNLSGRFKS